MREGEEEGTVRENVWKRVTEKEKQIRGRKEGRGESESEVIVE